MHVCMYVCMHGYVCMYVCLYICMYVYMYVCIYMSDLVTKVDVLSLKTWIGCEKEVSVWRGNRVLLKRWFCRDALMPPFVAMRWCLLLSRCVDDSFCRDASFWNESVSKLCTCGRTLAVLQKVSLVLHLVSFNAFFSRVQGRSGT